jgi:hypothetical protein
MSDLHSLLLTHDPLRAERILRAAHINVLSFYLMGKDLYTNHRLFNQIAIEVLKDPKIRGRRRAILEKFVGRIAVERMAGNIDREEEEIWLDSAKRR